MAQTIAGCWTCRLRRKKCDGRSPECGVCATRNITCFGSGPKPEWMDGGVHERAMREEIKRMLKDGNRRSRTVPGHLHPHSFLQPPDMEEARPQTTSCNADYGEIYQNSEAKISYYLEAIFPLHFGHYHGLFGGGEALWLRNLIQNVRPVYQAAISLSYSHSHAAMPNNRAGWDNQSLTPDDLEILYLTAISGLRERVATLYDHGKVDNLKAGMETLACIVFHVSIELLRGGISNWLPHLQAAAALIPLLEYGCGGSVKDQKLKSLEEQQKSDAEQSVRHELTASERVALDFFATAVIWFDTLSCVTTGSRPAFADHKHVFEDAEGNIRFDRIVGCENWVVVLIIEISALSEWKSTQVREGSLNKAELDRRVGGLSLRLTNGMVKCTDSIEAAVAISASSASRARMPHPILDIRTYIFASAAYVYLQVTALGAFPEQTEILEGVSRTSATIKRFQPRYPELARSVVWPFCVAGCLAAVEHEDDFRSIVATARSQMQSSATLLQALALIEECWKSRRSDKLQSGTWDCTRTMRAAGIMLLLI